MKEYLLQVNQLIKKKLRKSLIDTDLEANIENSKMHIKQLKIKKMHVHYIKMMMTSLYQTQETAKSSLEIY